MDCGLGFLLGALVTASFLKGRRWAQYQWNEVKIKQATQALVTEAEIENKEKYERELVIEELEKQF